jgi:uncharacterized membrane protein YedE/YeeE
MLVAIVFAIGVHVAVVCGMFCAVIAMERKNRDPAAWFLLGLIGSIVAVFAILAIDELPPPARAGRTLGVPEGDTADVKALVDEMMRDKPRKAMQYPGRYRPQPAPRLKP